MLLSAAIRAAPLTVLLFSSLCVLAFVPSIERSSRIQHKVCRFISHLDNHGVNVARPLTDLLYQQTTDEEHLAIKNARAVLWNLESQHKELRSRIAELETEAQRVDQERLRAQADVERLQKELLQDEQQSVGDDSVSGVEPARAISKTRSILSSAEAKPKVDLGLTGKTIGDGRYLLAGKPRQTTSGRSVIWTAYRSNKFGLPVGNALAIKISLDLEAMERENDKYELVEQRKSHGMFVKRIDFLPVSDEHVQIEDNFVPINRKCALVMERGEKDLKAYLIERGCSMEGESLRAAGISALKCLEALHASGLVWTDLKTRNFVVFQDEGAEHITIKGIDLESAMPVKGHPMDYTHEAAPPECARAILLGHASDFVLEYSYDVWSFGMFMYEISTGRGFFDGKSLGYITKMLGGALPGYKPTLNKIPDRKLADLIDQCLQSDHNRRPSVEELFRHPYFTGS